MLKNIARKLFGFGLTLSLLAASLSSGAPALAANGTMYLQPGTIMASGSSYWVQVRVNTGGDNVNAVQADLTYPTSKLTFVSIDSSGSDFDISASGTGGSGSISVARGASGTPRTGDLLVATLRFNVIATGAVTLAFQPSSTLLESTGSTNILVTKTNGNYTSIAGPLSPVYRLANWKTHERLFTTSSAERDNAVANLPGWVSEGTAFQTVPSTTSGAIPVYRLANYITHERLFTTSAPERDNATANLPGWVYEGISFYTVPIGTTGSIFVYRLANWKTHERLFTVDNAEVYNALNNLDGWVNEFTAFYAAP